MSPGGTDRSMKCWKLGHLEKDGMFLAVTFNHSMVAPINAEKEPEQEISEELSACAGG